MLTDTSAAVSTYDNLADNFKPKGDPKRRCHDDHLAAEQGPPVVSKAQEAARFTDLRVGRARSGSKLACELGLFERSVSKRLRVTFAEIAAPLHVVCNPSTLTEGITSNQQLIIDVTSKGSNRTHAQRPQHVEAERISISIDQRK